MKTLHEQIKDRILPVADTRFIDELDIVVNNICSLLVERLEDGMCVGGGINQLIKELKEEK